MVDDEQAIISQLQRENALLKQALHQSERVAKIGRKALKELKKTQQALRLNAKVMKNALDGIIVTDEQCVIEAVNPAFTTITGFTPQDAIHHKPNLLKSGKHPAGFYKLMWKSINKTDKWSGEIWNRRKNGELYPAWLTISTIKDPKDRITNYIGVFTDITKQKTFEKNLRHLAYSDGLTGLPNRLSFEEHLSYAIKVSKRKGDTLAVFFMDLDHFKEVNDTLGHDAGDLVLQETAHRLQACVRDEDIVARFGGDEYGIILVDVKDKDQAIITAEKILNAFSKPFIVKHQKFAIGLSIGVSFYPKNGQQIETVLKKADQAMYQAKESGRSQYKFA